MPMTMALKAKAKNVFNVTPKIFSMSKYYKDLALRKNVTNEMAIGKSILDKGATKLLKSTALYFVSK